MCSTNNGIVDIEQLTNRIRAHKPHMQLTIELKSDRQWMQRKRRKKDAHCTISPIEKKTMNV